MATLNQHRVYIPTNARANHYLLAEIIPNEAFYNSFSTINCCYERIARQLFACCDEYELHNVHLLATKKLGSTTLELFWASNKQYKEARGL